VQVDSFNTRVESAPGVCNPRWKLNYDEPLSNFACIVNVRRYTKARSSTAPPTPPPPPPFAAHTQLCRDVIDGRVTRYPPSMTQSISH